jgi:hypothetical protein
MKPSNAFRYSLMFTALSMALAGCMSPRQTIGGYTTAPLTAGGSKAADAIQTAKIVPFTRTRDGLTDAASHYDVAKFWLAQGRSPLALEALDRALAADPTHVESLNARASIRAANGDLRGAQADLMDAITLAPERAHLHYNQGLLKRMQQDDAGAQAAFRQALSLDPSHQGARAAIVGTPMARSASPVQAAGVSASEGTHTALVTVPAVDAPVTRNVSAESEPQVPVSLTVPQGSLTVQRIEPISDVGARAARSTESVGLSEVQVLRMPSAVGAQLIYPQQATDTLAVRDARIDIANGNGMTGLAKALRAQLKSNGLAVASISNWSNFEQPVTRVYYRVGYEQTARDIARKLPVNAAIAPLQTASARDVVVVLGRDMRSYRPTAMGWLEDIGALRAS